MFALEIYCQMLAESLGNLLQFTSIYESLYRPQRDSHTNELPKLTHQVHQMLVFVSK